MWNQRWFDTSLLPERKGGYFRWWGWEAPPPPFLWVRYGVTLHANVGVVVVDSSIPPLLLLLQRTDANEGGGGGVAKGKKEQGGRPAAALCVADREKENLITRMPLSLFDINYSQQLLPPPSPSLPVAPIL